MIKSFFSFLHRFFFSDDDPFKKPTNYEPYNETLVFNPVRKKRASRKKPAPMAVYKNKKKPTIRKKAA